MFIELNALQLSFRATETIHFPPGSPGNRLRGSFGHLLRANACRTDCPGVKLCTDRAVCAYAQVFEPIAREGGPSGLANGPRPFVFRAAHLEGVTVRPGESFGFGLNLFELNDSVRTHSVRALSQFARAELEEVCQQVVRLDLSVRSENVARVRVRFVTPTELKTGDKVATQPDFSVLFARLRDRLSTLRALYGPGPLEIDFKDLGARAGEIHMIAGDLQTVMATRRSSRTGQVHDVGGFVGWADYEGELAPFIPYLEAAKWTGVGRHCVWGNGEIEVWRILQVVPSNDAEAGVSCL